MSFLDTSLRHNRDWASRAQAEDALQLLPGQLPKVKALVIGCADMRVDPAHVLGIANGEAVIMRNIGGRVTPGLIEQLRMLGRIAEIVGLEPGGGNPFHVVVMQHTDCGFSRLANEDDMLASYFQSEHSQLSEKAVRNPKQAVAHDVAVLRSAGVLAEHWLVSGLVYDVETGLAEVVVAPPA